MGIKEGGWNENLGNGKIHGLPERMVVQKMKGSRNGPSIGQVWR